MKFIKGAIMGSVATATAMIVYQDMSHREKNKILKKGKRIVKKISDF